MTAKGMPIDERTLASAAAACNLPPCSPVVLTPSHTTMWRAARRPGRGATGVVGWAHLLVYQSASMSAGAGAGRWREALDVVEGSPIPLRDASLFGSIFAAGLRAGARGPALFGRLARSLPPAPSAVHLLIRALPQDRPMAAALAYVCSRCKSGSSDLSGWRRGSSSSSSSTTTTTAALEVAAASQH